MEASVKGMLKSVMKFDGIVAILTAIIFYFLLKNYDGIILLGLLVGVINFIMNAYFSSYALAMGKGQLFVILGAIIRVVVTCVIALVLYKYSRYYPIAFLGGYSLHLVAVIIYGLSIKKEGK